MSRLSTANMQCEAYSGVQELQHSVTLFHYVIAACVSRMQKDRCLMWDTEVGFWVFLFVNFGVVFF